MCPQNHIINKKKQVKQNWCPGWYTKTYENNDTPTYCILIVQINQLKFIMIHSLCRIVNRLWTMVVYLSGRSGWAYASVFWRKFTCWIRTHVCYWNAYSVIEYVINITTNKIKSIFVNNTHVGITFRFTLWVYETENKYR